MKPIDPDTLNQLILDYLYDDMKLNDRRKFELLMKQNSALQKQVDDFRETLLLFRQDEEKQQDESLPSALLENLLHTAKLEAPKPHIRVLESSSTPAWFETFRAFFANPTLVSAFVFLFLAGTTFVFLRNTPSPTTTLQASVSPAISSSKKRNPLRPPSSVTPVQQVSPRTQSVNVATHSTRYVNPNRSQRTIMVVQSPQDFRDPKDRRLDVNSVQDQLAAANVYRDRKEWNNALHYYQKVANLAPGTSEAMYALHQGAFIFDTIGETQKSMYLYGEILSRYPKYKNFDQVLQEVASIYEADGDLMKAHQYLSRCVKDYPQTKSSLQTKIVMLEDEISKSSKAVSLETIETVPNIVNLPNP